MATKKARPTHTATAYSADADPEALSPAELVAHEIVVARWDLDPSVERIMTAGLSDDETLKAITSFRDALSQPGDPNRDPRVAIASATAEAGR